MIAQILGRALDVDWPEKSFVFSGPRGRNSDG